MLLSLSALAADPETAIIGSRGFDEAFRDYYEALDTYSAKDLDFELSETIEDILSSGSHLTQTSLDYRVRQIKATLFARLRKRLCPAPPAKNRLPELKRACIRSIRETGDSTGVHFTHEEMGMLSGVAIRLLQRSTMEWFCLGG